MGFAPVIMVHETDREADFWLSWLEYKEHKYVRIVFFLNEMEGKMRRQFWLLLARER